MKSSGGGGNGSASAGSRLAPGAPIIIILTIDCYVLGRGTAAQELNMPVIDRREIEFDAEALLAAVVTSQRAAESFGLPGFPPTGVRFHPKAGKVDFLYGSSQASRAVNLKAEMVGALLVAYCIRARIPMPRKAEKGVHVQAHSVTLSFKTEYSQLPIATAETRQMAPAAAVKSYGWHEPERVSG
jgi:hypothetical protein